MLTISKPLSAGQAQSYHQTEFTAEEQYYRSQHDVTVGGWQGRLARQFGLVGAVSAEDFAKLSQGQHPQTGEQLVRQRASYEYQNADGKTIKTMEHRAGWDATFSAPKSVSLTALVGGDDRVRDAHRESVRVAVDQLEHYTQARIGGNHPPETTGKFIAAKFEQDTARPVDGSVAPQLHTHPVVFNVTERDNGQKDPALKSAVELLATGQVSAALDGLRQRGRVKEIPNREDRVRAIARGYVESPENTLIMSPDNASRRELNIAVRQELKANGTVASEDHKFSVPVQRQDMTGADRSGASRGLPRSLPQRKLLMTTHLFDNECDRSDLGVLCAVQHELVATVDHNANGISELEIAALASSRQPPTGCLVTARAALHNTSPVRANEVF